MRLTSLCISRSLSHYRFCACSHLPRSSPTFVAPFANFRSYSSQTQASSSANSDIQRPGVAPDIDNIPKETPDLTPHDLTNRPKRLEPKIYYKLERLFEKVDYEWLTKIPPKGLPRLDLPESRPKRPVPPPRNGMTVEKFLKTIGRGCEEYIDKLDWEKLFTSTGFKLKQLGIPIRQQTTLIKTYDPHVCQEISERNLTFSEKALPSEKLCI